MTISLPLVIFTFYLLSCMMTFDRTFIFFYIFATIRYRSSEKSRFARTLRCFWTNKITMRAENTHTWGKQNLMANVKNFIASGRSNLRKCTFVKIWIFPPITFFIFILNVETNYEIEFDYIQFGNWELAFSFSKLFFLILIDNQVTKFCYYLISFFIKFIFSKINQNFRFVYLFQNTIK